MQRGTCTFFFACIRVGAVKRTPNERNGGGRGTKSPRGRASDSIGGEREGVHGEGEGECSDSPFPPGQGRCDGE